MLIGAGANFDRKSSLEGTISLGIYQNLDQLRLRAFSRLPKVRSDIREYLKQSNALKDLTFNHIFDPIYSKNYLFF